MSSRHPSPTPSIRTSFPKMKFLPRGRSQRNTSISKNGLPDLEAHPCWNQDRQTQTTHSNKKQNPTFGDTTSHVVKYPLPSLCITRTCPNQRKLVENFHVRTTQAAPTGPDQGRSKHRRPQQAEEAQGRGQAQTQSQAQSQDAYPRQPPGPGGGDPEPDPEPGRIPKPTPRSRGGQGDQKM